MNKHEYQALLWHKNEEGIWLRAKMDFCSNMKKVTFLDVECRLSVILEAIPVQRIVLHSILGHFALAQ
jgi:hypothetical protein